MTQADYQAIALTIHEAIKETVQSPLDVVANGGLATLIIRRLAATFKAQDPEFQPTAFHKQVLEGKEV